MEYIYFTFIKCVHVLRQKETHCYNEFEAGKYYYQLVLVSEWEKISW